MEGRKTEKDRGKKDEKKKKVKDCKRKKRKTQGGRKGYLCL